MAFSLLHAKSIMGVQTRGVQQLMVARGLPVDGVSWSGWLLKMGVNNRWLRE